MADPNGIQQFVKCGSGIGFDPLTKIVFTVPKGFAPLNLLLFGWKNKKKRPYTSV